MNDVDRTPVSGQASWPVEPGRSGSPSVASPSGLGWIGRPDSRPSDAPAPSRRDWLDRLVELHVLASHGDLVAAAEAQRWIGHDEAAERVWRQIDQDCALLGQSSPGDHAANSC